jgi:hypothetical protein
MAGWADAPHLSEKAKAELRASTPLHLRMAREFGIPVLGSGRVFSSPESDIVVAPFPIPPDWANIGGMDFGWDHPFAACHLAWDRDKDCIYVVKDFRKSELTPLGAQAALDSWEKWLVWAWPHDGLQHDKGSGEELAKQYGARGFEMLPERATFEDGSNGLEAGIMEMQDRMETGRWKVFSTCALWLEEYRMYHRKDGIIVKSMDDTISASRYAMMMRRYAVRRPSGESRVRIPKASWRTA